jgi:hypothetical protein
MAQHDLDIANGSGAAVRADINAALAALGSTMKGPNAPPSPSAGMIWVEDDNPTSARWSVKMYDGADWVLLGVLDSTANRFEVASTATGLALLFAANQAAARTALGATTVGAAILTAADEAAARATIGVPALPTTGGGPGNWASFDGGLNTAAVLPSGGTYVWWWAAKDASGNVLSCLGGISAGGTTIGAASAGAGYFGWLWRTV